MLFGASGVGSTHPFPPPVFGAEAEKCQSSLFLHPSLHPGIRLPVPEMDRIQVERLE
jgi:hypothetical protein